MYSDKNLIGYTYSPLTENGSQYDTTIFEPHTTVDALYAPSIYFPGNPLIEALPPLPSEHLLKESSSKSMCINSATMQALSFDEQMLAIDVVIKNLKLFMPMETQLNVEVRQALLNSYGTRALKRLSSFPMQAQASSKSTPINISHKLVGAVESSSTTGFYMIGSSGCGKSTALGAVLSLLPQVIRHKTADGSVFNQIVYLTVTCPHNSNFRELYKVFGRAIDDVLNNGTGIYEKYMSGSSKLSLSELNGRLGQLIEAFGVGIIFLDESQNLRFNSAYDNSVGQLLNLSNSTKVSFCFIGTHFFNADYVFDADSQKTVRRVGNEIHADLYCKSFAFFKMIVAAFSKYQLFKPQIDLFKVPDLVESLFTATGGSIGPLKEIWIAMNKEYAERRGNCDINVEYMNQVIRKRCPHLFAIISKEQARRTESILKNVMSKLSRRKAEGNSSSFANIGEEKQLEQFTEHLFVRLKADFDGICTEDMIRDAISKALTAQIKKNKPVTEDALRIDTITKIQATLKLAKKQIKGIPDGPSADYIADYLANSTIQQ